MRSTLVPGACAALLVALVAGLAWGVAGHRDLDRTLEASALRDDLVEAHASVLGACVDLYERDFRSASRRLQQARGLLRRADQRGRRLGWIDEVARLDLARFEADIDEAQRLLAQFDREATSHGRPIAVLAQEPATSTGVRGASPVARRGE